MSGDNAIVSHPAAEFTPIVDLVINGFSSANTRDVYARALREFLTWWDGAGRPVLCKAVVQRYRAEVLEKPDKYGKALSPATVNQRLSAIRKLAAEAADNGLIPAVDAVAIAKVKGPKSAGVRSGNWLNKTQAQALINAPDISTVGGLRDRAILAVMIGAGLRRSEVAGLVFEAIQQREGRWVIVDLHGKGGRVRTVPVPSWCKAALDAWAEAAGISSGRVFRGIYRAGLHLQPESEGITAQVIYQVVAKHGRREVAPHDLRRTFAKLARKGGAELTQIQLTLGHANVATTQKYIGEALNLSDAPCDRLGLELSSGD